MPVVMRQLQGAFGEQFDGLIARRGGDRVMAKSDFCSVVFGRE